MVHALIFAGGAGRRMQSTGTPKQFLRVFGKPIIIHTVERFDKHPEIDSICIVCIESHIAQLQKYLKQYQIEKVVSVIAGGGTSQESIRRGLEHLSESSSPDDIVLIHDGVRPLIDDDLISRNIATVRAKGNAITIARAIETFCMIDDDSVTDVLPRPKCALAKAPQSFYLKDILAAHRWAEENNITDAIDSADLTRRFGKKLYKVECQPSNIKVTYPIDYYVLKGIIDAQESEQIMGI